jgi:uncharacterized SAM-binding protein YcdF (DUF218 family)
MMTVLKKLLKISLFLFACMVIGGSVYVISILVWPTPHKDTMSKHEAIIALTGEQGRIERAFTLLLDKKADKLLISGVLNRVELNEIIENNSTSLSNVQKRTLQTHCCITLDYIADTTETNAIESNKWIQKNNISSIILVTSAPHMPRSYLQFSRTLPNTTTITPYLVRTKPRLHLVMEQKFWSYAAREYIKFLGSWIRLERK